MTQKKHTFIGKNFKSIFFASTMSMLVEFIVLLSDKLIAGHMIGQDALSALMLVEPFFSVIIFIAYLIADGSDMLIAYERGRGDEKKADDYFSQSMILVVISGVLLTFIFAVFGRMILVGMCKDATLSQYALQYFQYIIVLPLFQIGSSVLYSVILYEGGEGYCNAFSGIYVVCNIILSIVFCKFMGIAGISLATLIANILGMIPFGYFLIRSQKGQLHFRMNIYKENVIKLFQISFSQSSIYLFLALYEIVMNEYLIRMFGADSIVVFTLVMNLQTFYLTVYEGLTDFVTSNVNIYLGEENYRGIRETMTFTNKVIIWESLLFSILSLIFAPVIVKMFGIQSQKIIDEGIFAVRSFGMCAFLYCVIDVYRKYYVSMKRIRLSVILNIVRVSPLAIFAGIILGNTKSFNDIWIGMVVGLYLSGMIFLAYLVTFEKEQNIPYLIPKEKMENQWIWDEPMTDDGIMQLVHNVENVMKQKHLSKKACFQAMQAIEESQIIQKNKNVNVEKIIIQCSLLISDQATIILRNTANLYDSSNKDKKIESFTDFAGTQILSSIGNTKYIIVQGVNREIFTITL